MEKNISRCLLCGKKLNFINEGDYKGLCEDCSYKLKVFEKMEKTRDLIKRYLKAKKKQPKEVKE